MGEAVTTGDLIRQWEQSAVGHASYAMRMRDEDRPREGVSYIEGRAAALADAAAFLSEVAAPPIAEFEGLERAREGPSK